MPGGWGLTQVVIMTRSYTLEYWQDGDWLVGKVKELPGVFGQGRTIEELAENVQDAYAMMVPPKDRRLRTKT